MNTLSDHQVELIARQVDNSKISLRGLREDLIDHICCCVEIQMDKGHDFDRAYREALLVVCPNGMAEIQSETIRMTTPKSYFIMKKISYFLAMLALMLTFTGALFKILHLPGAGVLLGLSFLSLILILLPLGLISLYNREKNKDQLLKTNYLLDYISLSLFVLAFSFKLFHLPGAAILLLAMLVSFVFMFLPAFFMRLYRRSGKKSDLVKYILGFSGTAIVMTGAVFKILHLPGASLLLGIGVLIVNFGFLPMLFYGMYKKSETVAAD